MLDTHVLVWLYTNDIDKISVKAQQSIEQSDLLISPIILLELQYLFEINRITARPNEIYEDLNYRIGLRIEEKIPWYSIVKESLNINWTRDPFDRLIISHVNRLDCNLITKDRLIIANYERAVW
jgi:PIN domain nuclease of toxin-antitoxin system